MIKVLCIKEFNPPSTIEDISSHHKYSLITGKIYDFGYENGAPVLYNSDGSFGQLSNFQIPFFKPLSEIREEQIKSIFE
jgi:hypothetical protein